MTMIIDHNIITIVKLMNEFRFNVLIDKIIIFIKICF